MDSAGKQQKSGWNGTGRAVLRFLRGMPFSFILLAILLAACAAGSIIPQNAGSLYVQRYGPRWGGVLLFLQLDHVFTCWWFVALAALLCLNLILCSVSRFPALWRARRRGEAQGLGVWGSWVTHLGLLLLIVSFAAGQYLTREAVAYGIAGSTQMLGDTGLLLTIDDFTVSLRDDYTVEQYTASLTVTDAAGEARSGAASVNHPFSAFGYTFYQDSTGWAAYADILKGGEPVKEDLLCTGEYTFPDDMPGLALLFNKFYPDLAQTEDGLFYSATPLMNDPHCLYSIYYNGTLVAMDFTAPGDLIPVHDYTFILHDPVPYTLIVAKTNPAGWLVGISAGILLAGLFLSFYVKPWEQNRRKQHADEPDS